MKAEATAAVAQAAGISLLTGTVLGLPLAAMIAGFAGGVVALSLMPVVASALARLVSVAASTTTAAFLAPYFAALVHQSSMQPDTELQAVAFVLGAGAQVLLPTAIAAAKRRIEQAGGITEKPGDTR